MKWMKLAGALAFTAVWLYGLLLNHPFGLQLPPIGAFFSPASGFWQNAENPEIYSDQSLLLPGLKSPVNVAFDERLVPHVFAQNTEDAAFIQGFLHAKLRLWQMDISARATGGYLSAVIGEAGLNNDRQQRRKGMVYAAERTVQKWQTSEEDWALIQAYADGVNAWIDQLAPKDYPLEFKLLNYKPEKWTPLKSALFFKKMAETLCGRSDDIEATLAFNKLGRELYGFLFPENNPRQSPVIPAGTPWDFTPLEIPPLQENRSMIGNLDPGFHPEQPLPFMGSNNWALSGAKTQSGFPVLCSDPHLQLTLPSVWFEIQLHTPDWNAYGVSFPSLPGILIGFNEHIAWAETNVEQDVLDWYAITWVNEEKTRYLVDDQTYEVEIREETIPIKGKDPVVERVKYTIWGPVVKENLEPPFVDLAMRWIAHDPPADGPFHDIGAFLRLMKAKNYSDYSNALEQFNSPAQNFAFAARDGDIALKVNGRFPLRRKDQGKFIQDGSTLRSQWSGFIPMAHIPQIKNPERGFIASSNQTSTAPDYPYSYFGYFDDYRGRYINSVLSGKPKFSTEEMKSLQNDNYSLKAGEGLPLLIAQLDIPALDTREKQVLDTLKAWDYRFRPDLKAPIAFDEWFKRAAKLTFDELAEADNERAFYPDDWRFLELLETFPTDSIFDLRSTPERETAKDMITRAFRETTRELAAGWDDPDFTWSDYKSTEIRHMANLPGMGSGKLAVGGYGEAPNAISRTAGPSWRMIVELGPEIRGQGVYPGGQSGNPGSKYYDNMIGMWSRGEYQELFFMKTPDDRRKPVLFTMKFE